MRVLELPPLNGLPLNFIEEEPKKIEQFSNWEVSFWTIILEKEKNFHNILFLLYNYFRRFFELVGSFF
jgi:hypothetical protein